MLLDCCTLTHIVFLVLFYFACRQQLVAKFHISMYFHAFVPLSITSSSGILVVLPAPLYCCSFTPCTFSIFILKKGAFLGHKGRGRKNFHGASHPRPPFLSLTQGPWVPETFPTRTTTGYCIEIVNLLSWQYLLSLVCHSPLNCCKKVICNLRIFFLAIRESP